MVSHQLINDNIRARTAVEDIAHNMQFIHCEFFNQLCQRSNKLFCVAYIEDSCDNLIVVALFGMVFKMCVQQLVDDIFKIFRQAFTHEFSSIFTGNKAANLYHTIKREPIPFAIDDAQFFELFYFLYRVINQCCKAGPLFFGNGFTKHKINFFFDDTRRIIQDMRERLVLPVQVTHKVFCALGQL